VLLLGWGSDGAAARFNFLRDEYAWKRVPNNVFFSAIRTTWNNYLERGSYGQGGTSSASSEQRNADVV
jgi:hypothetical protein